MASAGRALGSAGVRAIGGSSFDCWSCFLALRSRWRPISVEMATENTRAAPLKTFVTQASAPRKVNPLMATAKVKMPMIVPQTL